jgi:hypothetical protein
MSFSPHRVTLVINASIESPRVQTFEDATTVVKYFAVDDLIQPKAGPKVGTPHETASDKAGAAKQVATPAVVSYLVVDADDDAAVGHGKVSAGHAASTKPAPYACRKFEVKEVFRRGLDGAKVQLPRELFKLVDQGSLEFQEPSSRIRNYAEKRLVSLTFDGSALSTSLKRECHEQMYSLREALIEQADIRIDAIVEGKLLVSLFVKPVLALRSC